MADLNIWMPTYDDVEQLGAALASTAVYADHVDVHVIDGRYATFDGEDDLTPGAKLVCDEHEHVEYWTPRSLPLGDPEVDDRLRSPQHEQATWVNYDLLPGDEWALEMDTDERLETLDVDALAELDPRRKYTATVLTPDDEQLWPTIRLYQPRYWTFWIDDVMFWRDFYPRSTSLSDLFKAHIETSHRNTGYGGETEAVVLRNHGGDRPDEYQERRAQQLEVMGADAAAQALRDGKRPSLVDLSDYRVMKEKVEERVGEPGDGR